MQLFYNLTAKMVFSLCKWPHRFTT